jgi:phosphate uptake regulator
LNSPLEAIEGARRRRPALFAVRAALASGRMTLPVTMEMTLVARFYERLGDHAVNIARRVI